MPITVDSIVHVEVMSVRKSGEPPHERPLFVMILLLVCFPS